MTNFVFYNTIPFATDFPGDDQPLMLQNNIATNGWVSVDHVGFNTTGTLPGGGGGQHKQFTFDSNNVPATPGNPQAVLYTNVGGPSSGASVISQLYYANQNATFPISCIKAFCSFNTVATGTLPIDAPIVMQYNIVSVKLTSTSSNTMIYQITLTSNILVTNNPLVISVYNSLSANIVPSYTYVGGVITLTLNPINITSSGHLVNLVVFEI